MADFNDTYRKAGILMRSALEKYGKGDIEGGNRDRDEANKLYDKAEIEVNSEQGTMSMLYGENRNFGIAYKIFESNTPALFSDKKRKPDIKKILKLIKEDKVLRSEFNVYNMFTNPNTILNASEYVTEGLNLMPKLSKKDIIESNEKLINLMRKLNLNEMVELSDDEFNLFESIEYVMLNNLSFRTLNDYTIAKKRITEHVEKCSNRLNEERENKSIDEIYSDAINNISDKYDESLNEEEKKFIDELTLIEDKETYFNNEKNDTIKALNNYLSECDDSNKEGLNTIIENITKQEYSEADFISNIAEFREIKDTLE